MLYKNEDDIPVDILREACDAEGLYAAFVPGAFHNPFIPHPSLTVLRLKSYKARQAMNVLFPEEVIHPLIMGSILMFAIAVSVLTYYWFD